MLDSSFFVRFVVLLDAFCLTVRFVVFYCYKDFIINILK